MLRVPRSLDEGRAVQGWTSASCYRGGDPVHSPHPMWWQAPCCTALGQTCHPVSSFQQPRISGEHTDVRGRDVTGLKWEVF